MFKYTIFALLCMAATAHASVRVYKSVGADGKIAYSDHPSDQGAASVSIIKADIVQALPVADSGARKVCNKMVEVLVGPTGDILRVLPAKQGFATHIK